MDPSGPLIPQDEVPRLPTRARVLVLQHPQEPDKVLGTAALAVQALPSAVLRVGLSWPNLAKALGDAVPKAGDAGRSAGEGTVVDPKRWAVLYLGSGVKGPVPADANALVLVDKGGVPLADQAGVRGTIDGIVALDGTWSQAKALWWRNAWLLKLRRAILVPPRPSLYRGMRREPRRECVATIESIGYALTALGEPPEVEAGLEGLFRTLLARARKRPRPGAIRSDP